MNYGKTKSPAMKPGFWVLPGRQKDRGYFGGSGAAPPASGGIGVEGVPAC